MLDCGGNIALDEQIISGSNGDVLGYPPVVGGEGERGGTCCTVDGDLVAAGDVEGDGVGGCSAKNSAVDDGGAGIFCQACLELGLLEQEEFVAEGWVGIDAWKNGGGINAGECGDGGGAVGAVETVAVVLNEGVGAALGELDIAVCINKFRAAPEIACCGEAGGVECVEINDVPT